MLVTIIGSGNVATVMGRIFLSKGHTIGQVYSRNTVHATQLAGLLHAVPVTDLSMVDGSADLYLVAVTDDALAEVAARLNLRDKLVVHTAGSVSKEVLKGASSNYGVLWPMKMIRKSMQTLEPVTMVVDGSSEPVISRIRQIAALFSGTVTYADDAARAKMHMLAALTSNFANHLYRLAADYCEAEHIDLSLFYSIIEETALQIRTQHPKEVQAGPAFRGDVQTIQNHVQLLGKYPQIRRVYEVMTESIGESSKRKADG